jgi:hypothetical protein
MVRARGLYQVPAGMGRGRFTPPDGGISTLDTRQ